MRYKKPLGTQDIVFRGVWRRERDLNPCYPYGGKHDFESCAFDRSAISAKSGRRTGAASAFRLHIISYSLKFVNLSGKCFTDKVVRTPIIIPAATPKAHTAGSCTNRDGASITDTATQVLAMLLMTAPATLTDTRLIFGNTAIYSPAMIR